MYTGPVNYRVISLLPSLSKVYTHILPNRIGFWINMYKIVSIQGVLGGTDTILGVDYRAKIKKKKSINSCDWLTAGKNVDHVSVLNVK